MQYYGFDRTIRCAAAASSAESGAVLGTYDPLAFRIHIPGAEVNIKEVHASLHKHPTYFHELVHSWQLYAHPICVLTGCINSIEAAMAVAMLPQKYRLRKPFIANEAIETIEREQHFLTRLVGAPKDFYAHFVESNFFVFERLNAALDDPVRFSASQGTLFEKTKAAFESSSQSVLAPDLEIGFLTYMAMFYQEIEGVMGASIWPTPSSILSKIEEVNQLAPVPSQDVSRFVLGLEAIQEGQARFLELQLIALHDNSRRSLEGAKESGYLSSTYRRAFKNYLEWTKFSSPESLLDWRVHVFNVVCDYAMSGTTGYSGFFPAPRNLMDYLHPGARFQRACAALANSGIAKHFTPGDILNPNSLMLDVFAFLESAANLSGESALEPSLGSMADFGNKILSGISNKSQNSKKRKEYPKIIPMFNYLYRHFMICESRIKNKQLYANPLNFAVNAPQALNLALPWVITSSGEPQVIDIRRKGWDGDQGTGENKHYAYFIGHIYSDMVRQLITMPGPFKYEYSWMPEMTQHIAVKGAQAIFANYFGVRPETINWKS